MSNKQHATMGRIAVGLRQSLRTARTLWISLGDDKVALLLTGFLLTGVTGTYINARFQQESWERQKRCEILKLKLDSGFALVEQLASSSNNRFFGLQRVFWAIESNPDELDRLWKEYYVSVIEWNRTLNLNHMRILRLVGENEARAFLDYEDELKPESPASIHGRFKLAHDRVLAAKSCATSACGERAARIAEANQALEQLDIYSDAFVEGLTHGLLERAESMKLK
jgi:hypothetical protein